MDQWLRSGTNVEKLVWQRAAGTHPEQLHDVIQSALELDSRFDWRMMEWILARGEEATSQDCSTTIACMDALCRIAGTTRTRPALVKLSHYREERIRSRAISLLAAGQSPLWLQANLLKLDARCRANALEASYILAPSEELRQIYRTWAKDTNNRVAGNALLGLYRLGELTCLPDIFAMARNSSDVFRATAAWVMGRTEDPRFFDILRGMVRTESGNVRANAVRACRRVAMAAEGMQSSQWGAIHVGPVFRTAEGVSYGVIVTGANGQPIKTGEPFHFLPKRKMQHVESFFLFVRKKFRGETEAGPEFLSALAQAGAYYELQHALDSSETDLSLEFYSPCGYAQTEIPVPALTVRAEQQTAVVTDSPAAPDHDLFQMFLR